MPNETKTTPRDQLWRVGNHYDIHVYAGEMPVATFHRADDAKRAVAAVNAVPAPAGNGVREARVFAENTWGEFWVANEWGSLQEFAALATPVSAEEDGLRARPEALIKRIDERFDAFLDRYASYEGNVSTDDVADYLCDVRDEIRAALTPTPAESAPSGDTVDTEEPSEEEVQELANKCVCEFSRSNGVWATCFTCAGPLGREEAKRILLDITRRKAAQSSEKR